MDRWQVEHIEKNLVNLIKATTVTQALLLPLREGNVLTEKECESILKGDDNAPSQDIAFRFYWKIIERHNKGRKSQTFDLLLKTLKETENNEAHFLLSMANKYNLEGFIDFLKGLKSSLDEMSAKKFAMEGILSLVTNTTDTDFFTINTLFDIMKKLLQSHTFGQMELLRDGDMSAHHFCYSCDKINRRLVLPLLKMGFKPKNDSHLSLLGHYVISEICTNEELCEFLGFFKGDDSDSNPVKGRNGDGLTLLLQSFTSMHEPVKEETLDLFEEFGVKVSDKCKSGRNALWYAIQSPFYCNPALLKVFIRRGASVYQIKGKTLLHEAAGNHKVNPETIRYLIQELGIDVNARTDEYPGTTALHNAYGVYPRMRKLDEVVETLISLGANTKAEDDNGCTPLNYLENHACWDSIEDIMDEMKERSILDTGDLDFYREEEFDPDDFKTNSRDAALDDSDWFGDD